ncbi:probable basic-leucine zipper transcription factor N [Panonychus citri]|uniref:probable basic-leucine zipper transcription factor N n=1 Tax=Panonychus citri TaxID=50023 RepID=UPI002307DAD0|nr:probable basic-leucine zipper transcription factor N [Panonychus citri]
MNPQRSMQQLVQQQQSQIQPQIQPQLQPQLQQFHPQQLQQQHQQQLNHHSSHLLLPQPQYQSQYQLAPQFQQPFPQQYTQLNQQHLLHSQPQLPQSQPQSQPQAPQMVQASSSIEEAKRFLQSTNAWCDNDTPPQPPPRRRFTFNNHVSPMNKFPPTREQQQSVFYLCNNTETKPTVNPLYPNGQHDKLKEIHELAFKSPGRVKEHAQKLNKMVSESELKPPMPVTINSSPTPVIKTTGRTKCPSREEDNDSASVQPFDPLRRKWMLTTSNCDYTEMVSLLKKDATLAGLKDFTSGVSVNTNLRLSINLATINFNLFSHRIVVILNCSLMVFLVYGFTLGS